MRILEIEARNFRAFPHFRIDYRGASSVIGVRCVYPGSPGRSNRGGKSLVAYDAPLYALCGWSRTRSAEDVIRRGTSIAYVDIVVEARGRTMRVRRTQRRGSGQSIAIEGNEGLSIADANRYIEEFIGISVSDLRAISIFEQGDALGFLGGDQRSMLLRWLDQSHWTVAEREAGLRAREAEREAGRLSERAGAARNAVESLPDLRRINEGLKRDADRAAEEFRRVDEEARRSAEETESVVRRRDSERAVARANLESVSAAVDARLAALEVETESLVREVSTRYEALDLGLREWVKMELDPLRRERREADETFDDAVKRKRDADSVARFCRMDLNRHKRDLNKLSEGYERLRAEAGAALAARAESGSPCHVTNLSPCEALVKMRTEEKDEAARIAWQSASARRVERDHLKMMIRKKEKECQDIERTLERAAEEVGVSEEARTRFNERIARLAEELDGTASDIRTRAARYRDEITERLYADADVRAVDITSERQVALDALDAAESAFQYATQMAIKAAASRGERSIETYRTAARTARRAFVESSTNLSAVEEIASEADDRELASMNADRRARVYRIVRAAFSKTGIPARVVDAYLGDLSDDANAFLERLGAEPRVEWQTTRELRRWSDDCVACGAVTSVGRGRDRRCGECGASWTRARKDDFRCILRYGRREDELGSDSGGGKVLVALAVRFAVSQLVARSRGVDIGMIVLDEPFAALDATNLRSAVSLVTEGLAAYGVRQVFLISHLPNVQDAVGDLITVIREGDISRVETTWE